MHPAASRGFPGRKPCGFTLVELLIVLSVLIALTAIGVPALTTMKSRAEGAQCREHLRAWGIAIGSYAADHDGMVHWEQWHPISNQPKKCSPYVPYWTGGTTTGESLDLHLKQRCCPAVKWNKDEGGNGPVSYAMIQPAGVSKVGLTAWTEQGRSSDYPLAKVTKPARFILMIDATGNGGTVSNATDFQTKVKPLTEAGPQLRHKHSVNALMADFSIRTMTWDEIESDLGQWTKF